MPTNKTYNAKLVFGKVYDLSRYTKLHVEYMNSSYATTTTISIGIDSNTVQGDAYVEVRPAVNTTTTASIDISTINRSTIVGTSKIYFGFGNSSIFHIYHVWLS